MRKKIKYEAYIQNVLNEVDLLVDEVSFRNNLEPVIKYRQEVEKEIYLFDKNSINFKDLKQKITTHKKENGIC